MHRNESHFILKGREGEHEQGALSDGPHHLVLVTATVHLCAHLKQGELT